ncbi:MAG: Beta-N-acetylhexosaminidase, partial [Nocardioidaceae bacterium]|nr:Beta-N-acetylhexosaminidase [Nocardioidaceae bacterium]
MGRMGRTAIFAVAAVASTTLAPSAEAARPAPTVSRVSAADPAALAAAAYARMTPQQRVGQLFMAGITSTGATGEQLRQLAQVQAGNAFLRGHNRIGVAATRAVTDQVAATTTVNGVRPLVSADQEGGRVQALRGPGFSRIKAALAQGGVKPAKLQVHAAGWG